VYKPCTETQREVKVKRSTVAFAVLALVFVLAAPAGAKGAIPQSAQLTGPGLSKPITFGDARVGSTSTGGDINLLATETRLFDTVYQGGVIGNIPAPADLGPRYTITWKMRREFRSGKTFELRSALYPYAKGGAVVHTFGGQQVGDPGGAFMLRSGWATVKRVLLQNLHAWGLPKNPQHAAGKVASSSIAPLWAVMLGALVLISAALVRLKRRNPSATALQQSAAGTLSDLD
jgi:hypothetical protein